MKLIGFKLNKQNTIKITLNKLLILLQILLKNIHITTLLTHITQTKIFKKNTPITKIHKYYLKFYNY